MTERAEHPVPESRELAPRWRHPKPMTGPYAKPTMLTANPDDIAAYRAAGYWSDMTAARQVGNLAHARPHDAAFVTVHGTFTWQDYLRGVGGGRRRVG